MVLWFAKMLCLCCAAFALALALWHFVIDGGICVGRTTAAAPHGVDLRVGDCGPANKQWYWVWVSVH